MPGFKCNSEVAPKFSLWEGNPDSAAHQEILGWLRGAIGEEVFLGPGEELSNSVKGNLGEFIAYRIGKNYVFGDSMKADAANASTPLFKMSIPGVDIVWLYLGENASEDYVLVQEVKTTGGSSLRPADNLIEDYDKLFGVDPQLTLRTRLGALKNRLEEKGLDDCIDRLKCLGGVSPSTARGVSVLPTLLHDSAYPSSAKMDFVRRVLISKGWSAAVVECWSIALSDINNRLTRLARGQN